MAIQLCIKGVNKLRILDFTIKILKHWRSLALVFVCLLLIFSYNHRLVKSIEIASIEKLKPAMTASSLVADYFLEVRNSISDFIGLRSKYQALQLENQLLKDNILMLQQLYYENEELRALNKLILPKATRIATTRIINQYDGAYISNALILAGSDQQIKPLQIAVSGDGVIGQVAEVGPLVSRITLLTDTSSKIPVFFPRTKEHAVAAGNHRDLQAHYLAQTTQIKTGDLVLTSGDGAVFPYGLPVGTVSSVDGKNISIMPFYDLNKLDLVTILSY